MGEVILFPERINQHAVDFIEYTNVIDRSGITELELAELIDCMREYTDYHLVNNKNVRKLYKMLLNT